MQGCEATRQSRKKRRWNRAFTPEDVAYWIASENWIMDTAPSNLLLQFSLAKTTATTFFSNQIQRAPHFVHLINFIKILYDFFGCTSDYLIGIKDDE